MTLTSEEVRSWLAKVEALPHTSRAYIGAEKCGRYPCSRCNTIQQLRMFADQLDELAKPPRHHWRPAATNLVEWQCIQCDKRIPKTTPYESLPKEGCITDDEAVQARRVKMK